MSTTPVRNAYLWRAWSANRKRICDCGIVYGSSEDNARANVSYCIGGPWKHEIVEIQIEAVLP